ncbi:hypothetical protein ACVWZ4_003299 [Bradyrhizobium sp. USDA 4472]
MGVAVVMPVRMRMVVGMAVIMAVGRGGNHDYGRYIITLHLSMPALGGAFGSKKAAARATASVVAPFQGGAAPRTTSYAFSNRDSTYSQFTRFSTNALR